MLLRKPSGTPDLTPNALGGGVPFHPTPVPASANPQDALLSALKEELFALETERLQRRISEPDYKEARAAFELILGRTLNRGPNGTRTPVSEAARATEAVRAGEPVLTGREGA